MTIEIWQLRENYQYRNLHSWYKRKYIVLQKKIGVLLDDKDYNGVISILEVMFCDKYCVHKYKIKTIQASMINPDIFDSEWI